jgi:hypothetical protein
MAYRYTGLSPAPFAPLLALDDDALAARGMRRMIADASPGFPCRISLEDAEPGERVLLLAYEHQPARTPFRASGPIFIRERARAAFDRVGDPPPAFLTRPLSLRAYDETGMMCDADITAGAEIETLLARLFDHPDAAYIHVHYARRGCFAGRVERAH